MTEDATFSHDQRLVATASWDNTARVWEVATGQAITHPFLQSGWVRHVRFSPDDGLLAATTQTRAVALHDLAPAEGPAADLVAVAELLASSRVDENGGTVPLSLDQLLARFHRADDAGLLGCSRRAAFNWYWNQADRLIQSGRWPAAKRQLDEAIRLLPNHGPARLLRGEIAARLGQWQSAAEDFAIAVSHGETGLSTQCRLAALLAAIDDVQGFQTVRQRLLDSLDGSLGAQLQREIVRTCLLRPIGPTELAAMEKSLRTVLDSSTGMQAETLRIAFRYRAGTSSPSEATEDKPPAATTPLERREQLIFQALAARKAGDARATHFWAEYQAIAPPKPAVIDDWLDQLAFELIEREWGQ